MHGMGCLIKSDSTTIVGAWIDDKLNGSSTVKGYFGNTRTIEWENGEVI